MTITQYSVPAPQIGAELTARGVTHFVTMPDYVELALSDLVNAGGAPDVTLVNCATEDEAVTIALGLHIGGLQPPIGSSASPSEAHSAPERAARAPHDRPGDAKVDGRNGTDPSADDH